MPVTEIVVGVVVHGGRCVDRNGAWLQIGHIVRIVGDSSALMQVEQVINKGEIESVPAAVRPLETIKRLLDFCLALFSSDKEVF